MKIKILSGPPFGLIGIWNTKSFDWTDHNAKFFQIT